MSLPIPWKMEIKISKRGMYYLFCYSALTNEILTNIVGHLPTIAVLLFIIIKYNYCSSYSVIIY